MLKPEAAKKQLAKWQYGDDDGDAEDRFIPTVKKLPKKLRTIGYSLLDLDDKGEDDWDDWDARNTHHRKQAQALDGLTKAERVRLLRIFFGKLAGDLETTWQWMKRAPYTRGYTQTPFRAPKSPDLTQETRSSWLKSMITLAGRFQTDVLTPDWLAAWAPHLTADWATFEDELGHLFAAIIDSGGKTGDEVFHILCQSARKEHEIGRMGRHVTRALLSSSRVEGWELMEKMLLAAQRQEGLRQVILESVVEAHPEAFRRMLRIIVDKKLSRFSSVVRAMDVWFGMAWAAGGSKKVNDTIETAIELLEKPAARKSALAGQDAERAYLALWSIAFEDAPASVKPAAQLLKHKNVEVRYVGALHLARIALPQTEAARVKALEDEDLRVALVALMGPMNSEYDETEEIETSEKYFNAMERLYRRMPQKTTTLKPLVWPWTEQTTRRDTVGAQLVSSLGSLPPTRLIPHIKGLSTWNRRSVISTLAEQKKWDAATRDAVLAAAGDTSADVRESAFQALRKVKLTPADVQRLEGSLTRTAADLRKGVVSLVWKLSDKNAIASASRLLDSKNKNQRLAGLEVVRQLAEADRQRNRCIEIAEEWRDARKKVLKDEQSQLDAILTSNREVVTLDNALGLMDPAKRSKIVPPGKKKVQCVTAAIPEYLTALDNLVHEHRKEEITYKDWADHEQTELLGELNWGFPSADLSKPIKDQRQKLPLQKVWETWYRKRPVSLKDSDGLEILRTSVFWQIIDDWSFDGFKDWLKGSADRKPIGDLLIGKFKAPRLKYEQVVQDLIQWLIALFPPKGAVDFCLDILETIGALIPEKDMKAIEQGSQHESDDDDDDANDWRELDPVTTWKNTLESLMGIPSIKVTKAQRTRFWRLQCWYDSPFSGAKRSRPDFDDLIQAYGAKDANLNDVTDHLLGPRPHSRWGTSYDSLHSVTSRQPGKVVRAFLARPEIGQLVDRCLERVLEVELARGETASAATDAALAVDAFRGVTTLIKLLKALGKAGFKKLRGWNAKVRDSRPATFTQLIANTYPSADDTPEQFAKAIRTAIKNGDFPEERLLQLAFLAPQWTDFVEATMNWDGLAEGLYWYMAHMKYVWGIEDALEDDPEPDDDEGSDDDSDDKDRPEKLSRWERIIRERTPLTEEERSDGAIDVAWFHRTHAQLSPKRWEAMATAAKFAATSVQAKRAQLISDVLLGTASRKDLVDGIRKRNLKENVRLLGLLPLATGAKRDKDMIDRYEILQEYRRYANKLSSLSKPDALRACDIGMQNLAATAGYADPMRLQWSLEAESTKDLAAGPIIVKKGDVSFTLTLDDRAEPQLAIRRGEKVLKSLPKTVNKDKPFVELRERNKHLKRQASRVKKSLERAMCTGDGFTGAELMQLADHALLWPQLSRLVLVGEGVIGYPVKKGKALQDHAGKLEPVKKKEQFRIAHPFELLKTKQWNKWQHECFRTERLQPFKQVFRELYVVTAQEKKDKTVSNRYAGQQVNPRQAYALWGSRTWSVDEYENVFKAFHEEQINVSVSFNHGITTPLEVEGLTIESVGFRRRDEFKPLKLADVPPRIFSEVMRDMDLVVSVAHAGDVDPEATASTVEMRSSLLRETCQLLGLKNVKLKNSRAIIKGKLGEYSLHLGSGVVHRMPGGSVCIVPVHAQHRGRLFLPFADDDPRTAEVVSKTLLLARDDEIDDPIILEQLGAMA